MKTFHSQNSDSLDLLLDTICNVFGGIVLISCLLALLVKDRTGQTAVIPLKNQGEHALLERRMNAALEERQRLRALLEETSALGMDKERRLASERDELRKTLERLRHDMTMANNALTAKTPSIPSTKELSALRSEIEKHEQKLLSTNLLNTSAKSKEEDLRHRLKSLREQLAHQEDLHIEKLRFPREKKITKSNTSIILKFDEIFPLSDEKFGDFPGIRKIPHADQSFTAHPKKSEGLTANRDILRLKSILANIRDRNLYVAIYVYEDSFGSFRELKSILHESGLEYGISVVMKHEVMQFGPKGSAPPPL